MPKAVARDLRDSYKPAEVRAAIAELKADPQFERDMKRRGLSWDDEGAVFTTTYPTKYLGIEADGNHRFPLQTTMRIVMRPRSNDGASKGLRFSPHRKAFVEAFPDVDAALSLQALFDAAPEADLGSETAFRRTEYVKLARPALRRLQRATGIPLHIALRVLRKGLAAYKPPGGHRPGMTAHGWARARLTSFVFRGCTHYFPDHLLVKACPEKAQQFWKRLPCLCHKPAQCSKFGKPTPANQKARSPPHPRRKK